MNLANPGGDFFVADADISQEVKLFEEFNIPISPTKWLKPLRIFKWQMRWWWPTH